MYVAGMRILALCLLSAFALAAEAEVKVKVVEGQLSRRTLEQVMERGPQRFVAGLRVSPHLVAGRFVGFRIDGFTADGPLVNGRSILPGDVIVSVNQEPIERPEQFMRAWDVVKRADALRVRLLRGAQQLEYRWKLVP